MWGIAITWLLSSSINFYILIFFVETTGQIGTQLGSNWNFFIFRPILMQFLPSVHLNGLLMVHKQNLLFYFEKGLKFRIFEKYIEFLFFIQFWCVFFVVEWIVLSAFGSMLTDFLYILRISALLFFFYWSPYFNGLQLNIRSYIRIEYDNFS